MTTTIFQDDEIVIEETPQKERALVKINPEKEVLVQTPSEMGDGEVADNSEATNVAVGEYKSNFDQLWLSTIGSSVATGGNVLQAIKNDGTLYKLVSNTELASAGNGLKFGVDRRAGGAIKEHAKFAKVGGTAAVVASQVFAQGMLIQIAFQLAELQAAVEEIKSDLFEDFISSLNGSSIAVSDAIGAKDKTTVATSIPTARKDFKRLRDAIEREIQRVVSRPTLSSNWCFWKPSVQNVAEKQCLRIGKGLNCLFNSMRCVATGYSIIDQRTGQKVAFDLIREINSLPLEKLQDDLRALPYQRWQEFEETLQKTRDVMPPLLAAQKKKPVFILSGHEIHRLMKENTNG
jgi:hypothetical protein